MTQPVRWIDSAAGLAQLRGELAAAAAVAIDLEFNSEERYLPDLALIQLAWHGAGGALAIALCDPTAVDVAPLLADLTAKPLVAHAARQDLQLLASRFQFSPSQLWDTQIAAAFCGLGEQVGYAKLASALCGVTIDKGEQWTNWLRRPLSASQLTYAANDVRYLFEVVEALKARLGERVAWATEDSDRNCAVAYAHATAPPEMAWRDIAGARGLAPNQLSVLRRLAAWRIDVASRTNTPINRVLTERALIDVVRKPPRDARGFSERIHGAIATQRAEEVLDAVSEGMRDAGRGEVPTWPDEVALPARPGAQAAAGGNANAVNPQVRLWEELALGVVGIVAQETNIAARVLATRGDIESLVRLASALPMGERHVANFGEVYQLPLCRGWRRDVIAAPLLAFFRGEIGVTVADDASAASLRYF